MKTKEELNALKAEMVALNKKLAELSEEELAEVVGGRQIVPGISVLATLEIGNDLAYPSPTISTTTSTN